MPPATPAPPTVGRFEIRRELGRGAQSVVYLAWDPQLQREVAIKTLRFSGADTAMNASLLAEARAVSRLRHANIVPIFDAGEEEGYPYLVFEYVAGRSLAEAIAAEGRISRAQAADWMRQVLDGLAAAHAEGIVHRDLKPSNILMDGRGTPRVMDFGIAVRLGAAGEAVAAGAEGLSGTPAYMAPEYIAGRSVGPRMDIFAAGLILLEMLTGAKAVQGQTVGQLLYRIAHEDIALPKDAGIDDRLGDIVLKACARDPAARFESAVRMREALDAYLGAALAPAAEAQKEGGAGQGTLEFLLRRMRLKTDFPALSDSVSAINKLTSSDRENINRLSNTILKDYALTNKILRLVNSAYYRQAGGGNISTVSRAVVVLGFDSIRNIAVTLLLFEHLQDKANARELKEAFLRANLAGLLARDASQRFMARQAEEAFICSLFHGLGELLARYYFPEESEEIRKLVDQKRVPLEAASRQVLGLSFEELGMGIAQAWGFPPSIVGSMRRLPPGPVRKPVTHDEGLRLLAGFSNELCEAIAGTPEDERHQAMAAVSERFAGGLPFTEGQLKTVLEKSFEDLGQIAGILHVNLKQSNFARQVRTWTAGVPAPVPGGDETLVAGGDAAMAATVLADRSLVAGAGDGAIDGGEGGAGAAGTDGRQAAEASQGGVPDDAERVMTAGIQDISNSLVEDASLNDIMRIVLETMYRAMGFKRVLLCLRDAKSGLMVGRFGFGPDTADIVKVFRFPLTYTPDVFHVATSKAADIFISDIDDPKIADRVPAWYRKSVPARTFVLFPMNIKGRPVAMIYCDKDKAGQIAIPERELTLLKTLRNQALLAIKQAG